MRKREKFGKFVLLDEIDQSGLGTEYRAAKLGNTGLEKIVSVLRLSGSLSANGEAVKSLMDQVKFAAQLQNPNVVKIYGIGKVETSYYVSYEFLEGKSLRAIFNRCRQEGFPFSVDHALLIASKVCSALEYAHARKTESGARYFHGHVTPASVVVSYEGEVRLRGFGSWPSRIRDAGGVTEDELLYLSPEQSDGGVGDHRSDVFAVGLLLFETLTGQPFFQGGRTDDLPGRLSQARLQSPTSDDDSLPKPIAEILRKSLARDPNARYHEVQEMRKAVDTLLFSGDFTPTTFNLAFFMHSLFREDIEREARALKEDKDASYLEYLTDTLTGMPRPATAAHEPEPRRAPAAEATVMAPAAAAAASATPPPIPAASGHHAASAPAAHVPAIAHTPAVHAGSHAVPASGNGGATDAPALTPREAAAGFTFHKDEKAKGKTPVIAGGVAAVLLIGGVAAWLVARSRSAPVPPPAPPTTTLSAEAEAAVARVKELEDKLKVIEAEKAAAEAKAAEDAKKKMEAQAAAKGAAVDPAAVQKAQEEAARKARLEQEKKAAEERARLEEEKRIEEARLAEEKRKAEEEAARVAAAAAAAATTLPPAPVTQPPAPALKPGTLVNLSDPGVIAPVAERAPGLIYPPIALRQRVEGAVELNVLVDERGNVVDAKIVSGAAGKAGLNEAAIENVKKRKYRPASKEGIPVKVWVPVRVQFKLPS
jgi:TonB family protein